MPSGLYMDAHIPSAITEGLRGREMDVLPCRDDGMAEADDETLLQRATALDRVLVTQDDDLLAIASEWQHSGREFAGVVYAHQLGPGIGPIIDDLELLLLAARPEEIRNRVTYLPLD